MFSDTFDTPFFLLRSWEDCEACGDPARVVALVSGEAEPYVLTEISEMPEAFVIAMQAVAPEYRKVGTRDGRKVYWNHCSCGAAFEDFYLYCEPDGAFFPLSEGDAERIEVIPLPITGSHRIACSPGMGIGEIVLEYGKRVPWEKIGDR